MDDTILKINEISKSYKRKKVLDQVHMSINKKDIYGFVGQNGAGKTTLIRIISGLTTADEGSFELFHVQSNCKDIDKARKKVCTMVESPAIYPDLSAKDNLKMQCMITNKSYACINDLLSFVNLQDTYDKKASDFSLGMRQRLGIAIALVNDPQLMLLDEPINGLDPEGIKQVRELLIKLHQKKEVTILISSHILSELSLFATRYGFIDHGQIIKEATQEEISQATKKSCIIETDNDVMAEYLLKSLGYTITRYENSLCINEDIDLMKVCHVFEEKGIRLKKHICQQMDLETYFMNLIGEKRL
ncbi:MAG: ATP-binding cassette domain-containing protein [Traorella sp.]